MKRRIAAAVLAAVLAALTAPAAHAAVLTHTVVPGDTMWRLSVEHGVGLDAVIAANPHISDPHWIYPGDILYIPLPGVRATAEEREVIRLVNEERQKYGLAPLTEDGDLVRVARIKAEEMGRLGYFSHTSPHYGTPFAMMHRFGIEYRTAGENIAAGYATPEEVVRGWMLSSGHRANILNPDFTRIGVGCAAQGRYWTQLFAG